MSRSSFYSDEYVKALEEVAKSAAALVELNEKSQILDERCHDGDDGEGNVYWDEMQSTALSSILDEMKKELEVAREQWKIRIPYSTVSSDTCSVCHENYVDSAGGFDTCSDCIRKQ